MPTISVIVPVYKVEKYLDRCVKSILDQTYTDYELILVDDGSPDGCGAMCDGWAAKDSRITVIHKENGGLSDARNVGFENSQGEWITFVDSDDYVHPQMLEALYGAVMTHGVQVSVCGYAYTEGEPLLMEQELTARLWTAEKLYMERNVNATVAWGKLYHSSVVLPYPKGKLHEDEYVTFRFLFACEKIAVLDAPLYGYFQNPKGITGSGWNPRRLDVLEALEAQTAFFKTKGFDELYRQRARYALQLMTELLREQPLSGADRKRVISCGKRIISLCRGDGVFQMERDGWLLAPFYPRTVAVWSMGNAILKKLGRR